ncbi:MAG TPA: hypothetical protein VLZ33_05420 [Dysgonamonadaceae bacterium]|nr:hypothetical protein [Dysgonamonadaceae bacterium]
MMIPEIDLITITPLERKSSTNIPINKHYPAGKENALIDGLVGGLAHGDSR